MSYCHLGWLSAWAFVFVCAASYAGQPAPPDARGRPGEPQGGPYFHRICSASSADGLTWKRDDGIRLEHCSVPCAVAAGDKVFLYYVDADRGPGQWESAGSAVSTDGVKFEKQPFAIEGMPSAKALDPCVMRDADGTFRLYYYACEGRPDEQGKHNIRLALSSDGIRFKDAGLAFARERLVDPDVFAYKGTWFMYVFGDGNTLIVTSQDGRAFTYKQELGLAGYGTTAPMLLEDGRLRLYAFEQRVPRGNGVLSFVSQDGVNWTREDGVRLRAAEGEQITDPFVVRWQGSYKMYLKSDPRTGGPGPSSPGRPMAGQPGPWDSDVLVYRSGPDGKVEKLATFERAGVPTIARLKDGRLIVAHQHFPENAPADFDKVAVRFSADAGRTWGEPKVVSIQGLPEGMRFPFDPTLVPLPDGRVRLYFTSTRGRTFEAGTPAIYSAISDDGVSYRFEDGARFGIEGRIVIDCAVVLHRGVFHLYAPDNGPAPRSGGLLGAGSAGERPREGVGYHATSKDGLAFTRDDDVTIEGRRRWLGNAQSDGRTITFYGTGEPLDGTGGQPRGGLWMATSEDGRAWQLVAGPAVSGGDPGAVSSGDGGLIVVITGGPRAGTPSARQQVPGQPPQRGGRGPAPQGRAAGQNGRAP